MASWIQNQLRAAEDLLHAVDRTAKTVSSLRERDDGSPVRSDTASISGPRSTGVRAGSSSLHAKDTKPVEVQKLQSSMHRPLQSSVQSSMPLKPLAPVQTSKSSQSSQSSTHSKPPAITRPADVSSRPTVTNAEGVSPAVGHTQIPRAPRHSLEAAVPPSAEVTEIPSPPQATLPGSPVKSPTSGSAPPAENGAAAPSAESGALSTETAGPPGGLGSEGAPTDEGTPRPSPESGSAPKEGGEGDAELGTSSVVRTNAEGGSPPEGGETGAAPPKATASPPLEKEADGKLHNGDAAAALKVAERGPAVPREREVVSRALLSARTSSASEVASTLDDPDGRGGDTGASEDDGGTRGREARLVKMVDQLKRRLEQCRAENEQLEEMLRHADARATGGATDVSRLEDALARADVARVSAEAALSSGLAAKEAELESARRATESVKQEAAALRGKLTSLEEANQNLIRERQASEGRILQAVREEVAATEARLEDERAAHARTRREMAEREQQIEGSVAESAKALTDMQSSLSEKTRKLEAAEGRVAALERNLTVLQREHAALQQTSRQEGAPQASAAGLKEIAALKATCDQLRGAARSAQGAEAAARKEAASARAECETLRVELAQAAANAGLEQRFKEVTDLLYLKQTQLEKMAADKAAQQLALERELAIAREDAERIKRRVKTERASAATFASEGDVVVPMEAMGEAYYRLANNDRVGGAVKAAAGFMDASAATVVRFLKQYPLGRLFVFAYVVFIHLFIWLLINRLQHRALSADRGLGLERAGLN